VTRRSRLVMVAAGVLVFLAGAPLLLRRASFFRVRQVEVVGAVFLTGGEVARSLDVPPSASLFDPLGGLAKRVTRLRGVRRAEIGRRWPGTLVVRIVEAQPVALTPNEGKLALMDETATVLPFDPTRAPPDLPVAQRDSAVAGVLARVRETEPVLFAGLQAARRVRGDVALEADGRRYLLRADASAAAIRALASVARDLARRGRNWDELDARFADRVFVRGMTS
jgi:cell division protein FtsQ